MDNNTLIENELYEDDIILMENLGFLIQDKKKHKFKGLCKHQNITIRKFMTALIDHILHLHLLYEDIKYLRVVKDSSYFDF